MGFGRPSVKTSDGAILIIRDSLVGAGTNAPHAQIPAAATSLDRRRAGGREEAEAARHRSGSSPRASREQNPALSGGSTAVPLGLLAEDAWHIRIAFH